MDSITLVPATAGELPLVQRLAHVVWHRHYPGIITREQIDYMLERGYASEALAMFLDSPGAGLVLAYAGSEPVGFVAWYRPGAPATTKLDKLYVLPERHGAGIGRRLIEKVEAAARDDGSDVVIINVNKHNAKAIAAYRKCGYEVREEVVADIGGGFVMDDFVMAKALR
jgi:GNAT superfamily N-acetyltransferase